MDLFISLWLPILLSTLGVFIASFLLWAVLPLHKPESRKLPDEGRAMETLRSMSVKPGMYMFPYCGDKDSMNAPDFQDKKEKGPHGYVLIWSGWPNMGRNLALTFIIQLLISGLVAYIATLALEPGAAFLDVFQVTMSAAILGYVFGGLCNDIWFGKPVRAIATHIFDAIVYSLITAFIFSAMWPAAPAVIDADLPPIETAPAIE